MASRTELVLQCRSSLSATVSTGCLKDVDHHVEKIRRLEDYLKALEDECRKIEAFKRELPFCMQLLHKAIEASKEQLGGCVVPLPANSSTLEGRVTEANGSSRNMRQSVTSQSKRTDAHADEEGEMRQKRFCWHTDEDHADRRWMTEAESCMQSTISQEKSVSAITAEKSSSGALHQIEHAFTSASKPCFHSSSKLGTGAFVPFSKDNRLFHPIPLRPVAAATNGHNVDHTAHHASQESKSSPSSVFENCSNLGHSSALKAKLEKETLHNQATEAKNVENHVPHAGRKARRSWSAELHRLFVNALMQLGGCDVATPKQIREVMNVEGLTNDEVKSHLQKYRLHSRRATLSQNAMSSSSPQVVVLGGIWLPADYAAHHTSSGYGQNSSIVQQPLPVQTQAEFSYSTLSFPHGHHMPLQNTTEQQQQLSAPAHSYHGSRSEAHREESVDEGENSICREQEPTIVDKFDTYMDEGTSAAEEQERFGQDQ